jgi:hypothetical protein
MANLPRSALSRITNVDPLVVVSIIVVTTVLGTEARVLNIAASENNIYAVGIDRICGAQVT